MKVTLKELRQIITEEIIKEELSADIAAPAIAAMLQGTEAVDTSEIFGAVFDEMYGEGALEGEAERMASAEEEPEEDFPTEYQPGGGEGDRPVMGFKENMNEIIQEELRAVLNEKFQDPGGEADPGSHWGQERQKKEKDRAWAAGSEERGKENEKKERRRLDLQLQANLDSYVAMLEDFTEKAIIYRGSYGDNENIMTNIVRRIYGKFPHRYAADITSIDRKVIQELGGLIRALAEPYNAANQAMQKRDREAHPESYDQELRRKTDLWLATHGVMQESDEAGLKEKNNPWAICTASVGREDKDKYEKCVKSVKKEKGIK